MRVPRHENQTDEPRDRAVAVLSAGVLASTPAQATAQDGVDRRWCHRSRGRHQPFKYRYVITYNTNLMTYDTLIRAAPTTTAGRPGHRMGGIRRRPTWTHHPREVTWSDGEP